MPGGEGFVHPSLTQYLGQLRTLFTQRENLLYLGVGTALSIPLRIYDDDISRDLAIDDPTSPEVEIPDKIGNPLVPGGIAVTLYAAGRIAGHPKTANTGLYLTEALFTTYASTLIVKFAVHRRRPNDENSRSFPSGHASGMFTLASLLDKRYGAKVGIPLYAVAAYVAFSRVRMRKHFPTDVVAGATLGILVGRSFVPEKPSGSRIGLQPVLYRDIYAVNLRLAF